MGKLITTVTLNAAIDKTYYLRNFPLGKVSRIDSMLSLPGGKGINVARVIRQLGGESFATGYIGGYNGMFIERELAKQGIPYDFVKVSGESRICLNIIQTDEKSSTELLEPGPTITSEEVETMKRKVCELARRSRIVAFSGSIPTGIPNNIYADLIEVVKAEGAMSFLDTSGDAFLQGVLAKPYFIKPNEDEIQKILGKPVKRESDLFESIRNLMRQGIACVAVSLGAVGAVAGFDGLLYRIKPPAIEILNTVGCGDAFVAGMAVAMAENKPIEECLRLATASGTANALTVEGGNVRSEDVGMLLEQVEIVRIDL